MTGHGIPYLEENGIPLSCGFKALKAWVSYKKHGLEKYGCLIRQNIGQIHYLKKLIDSTPELEPLAPVNLNVVRFRYVNLGLDNNSLDALNKHIVVELQDEARPFHPQPKSGAEMPFTLPTPPIELFWKTLTF